MRHPDEIEINGIRFTIPSDDEETLKAPADEEIISTEAYGDLLVRPVEKIDYPAIPRAYSRQLLNLARRRG